MRKFVVPALLASAVFAVSPAYALTDAGVSCAASDIGLVANASFDCAGFYSGNLASASTTGDQTAGLLELGLVFPNAFANKIEKIEGMPAVTSTALTFATTMYGLTYIGVHWGNIPNPEGGRPLANDITSFYKFDAGTDGINSLTLAFNSASNATIYKTGEVPAVPEPATWAMMIGGLGLAGAALRRRATKVQFA